MMVRTRGTAGVVVPCCALLICAIVGQALGQQGQRRPAVAPAFVWSPGFYVSALADGVTSRVSYETAAASTVAGDLLDTLLAAHQAQLQTQHLLNATALQHAPPETVVFFVGRQVSTDALAQPAAADALQPLRAAMEAAGSSLSLPYVLHKGGESVADVVTAHLSGQGLGASLHQLGCSGEERASAGALSALLASLKPQDRPQVVLVCSHEDSLSVEMELLHSMQAAVADTAHAHIMVYAADPASFTEGPLQAAVGRALLQQQQQRQQHSSVAQTYTCDAKCDSQVKLLEAVILAINLIIAVLVGTCMLNNLGTPTRFETPKESGQRD